MNRLHRGLLTAAAAFAVSSLIGLVETGKRIGWGPFGYLYDWDEETDKITDKYDPETGKKEIIFYGASNFRLWKQMEEDLKEYRVQNHGFGGSTDVLLMKYAEKLLYPYEPKIVVFQTGSNDYAGMKGSDEQIAARCMEIKKEMFETFHERLPEAKFIVMSGILMPGRAGYTPIVQLVNEKLKAYCADKEYLFCVDAEDLTYEDGEYRSEYFIKDGIHLTHEARLLWADAYIRPMIEEVIRNYGCEEVRK